MLHLNVTEAFEALLWVTEAVVMGEVGQLDDAVAVGGDGARMRLCGLRHDGVLWRTTTLKKTQDKRKPVMYRHKHFIYWLRFCTHTLNSSCSCSFVTAVI